MKSGGQGGLGWGMGGPFHWRGELVDKRNLNKCLFFQARDMNNGSVTYEATSVYIYFYIYIYTCIFSYVTGVSEYLSQYNLNLIPSKTIISNRISCWVSYEFWALQQFSFAKHMCRNLELLSNHTIRESIKCPFKGVYFYEI